MLRQGRAVDYPGLLPGRLQHAATCCNLFESSVSTDSQAAKLGFVIGAGPTGKSVDHLPL